MVARINSQEDLVKLIRQEPLVVIEPSIDSVANANELPNSSYFGIGLCNGSAILSQGLPVDILGMILVAENVSKKKQILIADTHATTNGFEKYEVEILANQYELILNQTLSNLSLDDWSIQKASEIDCSKHYKDLLSSITVSHDYIRRELADMLWFSQERNVDLKVGWAMNGTKNSDERLFDRQFQEQFGNRLSFIYTVPGMTFDPKKLRSAPYFCGDSKSRVLLNSDEDAVKKINETKEKFGPQATKPYEKFLNQIVRLYDKTVSRTERGTVGERIQQVIERCTQ